MRILLLIMVFVIAGCVTTEKQSGRASTATQTEAEETAKSASSNAGLAASDVICKREKVTGTYRSVQVCRTKAQMENEKAEADRFTREVNQNARVVQGGDG
ncbi:MAG: hypothetical protein ABGY96_00990 [bacterium]|nr:hypothetical protein [Gammaproteobacteria bacterium]